MLIMQPKLLLLAKAPALHVKAAQVVKAAKALVLVAPVADALEASSFT
jgi:hypothetical protein